MVLDCYPLHPLPGMLGHWHLVCFIFQFFYCHDSLISFFEISFENCLKVRHMSSQQDLMNKNDLRIFQKKRKIEIKRGIDLALKITTPRRWWNGALSFCII
eukprot:TRINITY_DN3056_c0_g1_i6.p1 TRINITY_DN3056_c0_g1~~TRINITY_DN3056_c0_g1_i6.p1  ORF type:complete len:101 (+),score=18.64 TRINITY_DN3056_c0_g1_i6:236-538(+)